RVRPHQFGRERQFHAVIGEAPGGVFRRQQAPEPPARVFQRGLDRVPAVKQRRAVRGVRSRAEIPVWPAGAVLATPVPAGKAGRLGGPAALAHGSMPLKSTCHGRPGLAIWPADPCQRPLVRLEGRAHGGYLSERFLGSEPGGWGASLRPRESLLAGGAFLFASILNAPSVACAGGVPAGLKGTDYISVGLASVGSNPTAS